MNRYWIAMIGAAAAATAIAASAEAGRAPANLGSVTSGRVADMSRWWGRAGGLAGSDRVEGLRAGGRPSVVVTYDVEVERRTNMPAAHPGTEHVLATWDEGVAKRTHMPLAAAQPRSAEHPFVAPRAVQ